VFATETLIGSDSHHYCR